VRTSAKQMSPDQRRIISLAITNTRQTKKENIYNAVNQTHMFTLLASVVEHIYLANNYLFGAR
jgi:hypothetical protein